MFESKDFDNPEHSLESSAASTKKKRKISNQQQQELAPLSVDITHLVDQAVARGMIVSHEARTISMDAGVLGHFRVTAQKTEDGPKILSATLLVPSKSNNSAPIASSSAAAPPVEISPAVSPIRPVLPGVVMDAQGIKVINPEILRSVAGPEASDAKLGIHKEGDSKVLTLTLSNGEVRRLTQSQVSVIQAAIRNSTTQLPLL